MLMLTGGKVVIHKYSPAHLLGHGHSLDIFLVRIGSTP